MRALIARYPALAGLTHVDLGVRETPLERWQVGDASLLVKRDDLSASTLGGNKVRALELLLGGVERGDRVLTVGATGSTHALAVARYCAALGAHAEVITWPQEEHAVSRATACAMAQAARVTPARSVGAAYVHAMARRLRGRVHWIAAGGSVPRGVLGHVSAALELADQLTRASIDPRLTVVAPLGSGGTVAGLLVGLALAGLPTPLIGVQVVPRLVASATRVRWLAHRTRLSGGLAVAVGGLARGAGGRCRHRRGACRRWRARCRDHRRSAQHPVSGPGKRRPGGRGAAIRYRGP